MSVEFSTNCYVYPPPQAVIERTVSLALEEDLGRGDITTDACVAAESQGAACVQAREPLVWCGAPIVREVYRQVNVSVVVEALAGEGACVNAGQAVLRLEGPSASLLKGERVALNFVQRMSGVATMARRFVDALPKNASTRIVDTRKTTPGLRAFERYAVRCGGAHNHREDLSAAVLIKDNHIAAADGITKAIARARAHAAHTSRIECEVDTHAQLVEALKAGADILLLDNFDNTAVEKAIATTATITATSNRRVILEASGGISLERVHALGTLGVDVISVGALTHSARAVDLGLDWEEPTVE